MRCPGGSQEQPLSVATVDADHVKACNDRYGHLAGDECLRLIGRTIESVLWRRGDHAARCGGAAFVMLLLTTDAEYGLYQAKVEGRNHGSVHCADVLTGAHQSP
jgi:diguanylate cyclase (GGDEF)-like protein